MCQICVGCWILVFSLQFPTGSLVAQECSPYGEITLNYLSLYRYGVRFLGQGSRYSADQKAISGVSFRRPYKISKTPLVLLGGQRLHSY
jgi:hypothetical protein